MVTYLSNPQVKLTVAGTEIDGFISGRITRVENGFDTANFTVADAVGSGGSRYYPTVIDAGKAVTFQAKDAAEQSWTTEFNGIIRFVHAENTLAGEVLKLSCDGAGYGFADTVVAKEYGSQSTSGIKKFEDIVSDVITNYVNKILGGSSSGFNYTTLFASTTEEALYIYFPYKPCIKAIQDICDLHTAARYGTGPGPHWIVDTDNKFRYKPVGDDSQSSWRKYYGGSQSYATLTQDADFSAFDIQPLAPEANYIIYYGVWLDPPGGDLWTENYSSQWGCDANVQIEDSTTTAAVGSKSLKAKLTSAGSGEFWYNADLTLGYNLTLWNEKHVPTLNFYFQREGSLSDFQVRVYQNFSNYFYKSILADAVETNKWYHASFPLGPYYKHQTNFKWDQAGSPSWSNIQGVGFYIYGNINIPVYVDGLWIGGVPICRIAYSSSAISSDKVKTKVIVDNVGKNDMLVAADDYGAIAQLAKAELLRCMSKIKVGYVITPYLKGLLPGQFLHIHAKKKADGSFAVDKDMRVTKLVHEVSDKGLLTIAYLTDDLTNSYPRAAYDDVNKVLASVRPEFQDRQASNIKAGEVDIHVPVLAKNYG